MVGYNKHDSMTTNDKLIAGCASGVITRFVTQPMDVIKIRTQLQKQKPNACTNVFKVMRRILKEEGITAFWQGHNLGQVHSILGVSSQFFVYEISTRYVASMHVEKPYKKVLKFMCGILAGCCSATLVIPLEVIRVRQILVQDQYRGLLNGAKMVYTTGGILAFYEGLTASLLQMGPQVGVSFCVFSTLQPLILQSYTTFHGNSSKHSASNKYGPEALIMASSIAGSTAGFISKTLTYPLDLAKRRLQIGSHKVDEKFFVPSTSRNLIQCKKLKDCIYKTIKYEGLLGLFQGWKITVYKAQMTSIVAFTSYEIFCYTIREMEV